MPEGKASNLKTKHHFKKQPAPRKKREADFVDLEAQLAGVLEREGVTISVSPAYRRPKFERVSSVQSEAEPEILVAALNVVPEMTPPIDEVRHFDVKLINRAPFGENRRRPKFVDIAHGNHEASGYLVRMQGSARKAVVEEREACGTTIRNWRSPYLPPPSLEMLILETTDLSVDEVDPRLFGDQFTPADPEVAYREQYGWWSKLRAPFIRWEIAAHQPVAVGIPSASLDETPEEIDIVTLEQVEEPTANRVEPEIVTPEVTADNRTWQVPVVVPKLDLGRVMVGFFVLLGIVILPASAVTLGRSLFATVSQVRSQSEAALQDVRQALKEPAGSAASLGQANQGFKAAEQALAQANTLAVAAANAIPQTRSLYQSASSLLIAGQKSTEAAQLLAQGLDRAINAPTRHPDERLISFGTYLAASAPLLDEAVTALAKVKIDKLPGDIQPQVEQLKTSLAMSQSVLRDFQTLNDLLVKAVGHDQQRKYLVIFQNDTELRPTGGFMGSLAEITLDQGELKRVYVPGGGPYDFKNQLLARVTPPQPLQLVGERWEFQDANWFPDFPAAAKKIRWFWSKSGQPTLDGVIAVNASLMQKILAVSGPIEMPEYGKTITADNFLLETQKAVELEYDKQENKPKKFIGDLLGKLLGRIKEASSEQLVRYLAVMADALETKEIQVALSNSEEDEIVQRFGWSGRIQPSYGDALAIVEANIAGQKTDGVIDEKVEHEAEIQSDGTIIDTVTLTRHHNGLAGELFRGANNVEYVRVYVPAGSELLSAEGLDPPAANLFHQVTSTETPDLDLLALIKPKSAAVAGVDVTEEFGRTAFGGWLQLKPGQTTVTRFRYRLPFTAFALADAKDPTSPSGKAAYVLELSSQSGKLNRNLVTRLKVPDGWYSIWSNTPSQLQASADGLAGKWDRDQIVAKMFNTPNVANSGNTQRVGEAF